MLFFLKSRAFLETEIAGWFDLFIFSSLLELSCNRGRPQAGCAAAGGIRQGVKYNVQHPNSVSKLFQRMAADTFLFRGLGLLAIK